MRRGTVVFLVLAAIVAAICVRLGIWQLGRLAERRAANALVSARLDSAVVDVRRLPADTALAFADRTARRLGPLVGRHRVALTNLRNAYPEKTEEE